MDGAIKAVAFLLALAVVSFLVIFVAQFSPQEARPAPSVATRMSMVPEDPAELEAYVATRPSCLGEEGEAHIHHKRGVEDMTRTIGKGFGCWMRWTTDDGNNIHFELWTETNHHFCVRIYGVPGILKCDPTRDWDPNIAGELQFKVIGDDRIWFHAWDDE